MASAHFAVTRRRRARRREGIPQQSSSATQQNTPLSFRTAALLSVCLLPPGDRIRGAGSTISRSGELDVGSDLGDLGCGAEDLMLCSSSRSASRAVSLACWPRSEGGGGRRRGARTLAGYRKLTGSATRLRGVSSRASLAASAVPFGGHCRRRRLLLPLVLGLSSSSSSHDTRGEYVMTESLTATI